MRIIVPDVFETFHLSAVKANPGLNIPPFQEYVNNTYSFEGGDENATYDQAHVINVTMAGETELTPVLNFKCKRRNISDLTDLLVGLDVTPWLDDPDVDAVGNGHSIYISHINSFIGNALQQSYIDQSATFTYDSLTKMVTLQLKAVADNPMWYGSSTLQMRACDGKGIITIGAASGNVGYNSSVSNQPAQIQPMGGLTNPDNYLEQKSWFNLKPTVKAILWGRGPDISTQRVIDVIIETNDPYVFPYTINIGGSQATVVDFSAPYKLPYGKYLKQYSFDAELPIGGVGDALTIAFSRTIYLDNQP